MNRSPGHQIRHKLESVPFLGIDVVYDYLDRLTSIFLALILSKTSLWSNSSRNFLSVIVAYNGLGWLIEKTADTSSPYDGTVDQTRQRYYSAAWQLVEERIDDTSDSTFDHRAQLVWGAR
jgi:hypothetical protein